MGFRPGAGRVLLWSRLSREATLITPFTHFSFTKKKKKNNVFFLTKLKEGETTLNEGGIKSWSSFMARNYLINFEFRTMAVDSWLLIYSSLSSKKKKKNLSLVVNPKQI